MQKSSGGGRGHTPGSSQRRRAHTQHPARPLARPLARLNVGCLSAFGRARSALVLGPKPLCPSTFQPWLRPAYHTKRLSRDDHQRIGYLVAGRSQKTHSRQCGYVTGSSCAFRIAPTVYRLPEPYNDTEMTFTSASRDTQRQHELLPSDDKYLQTMSFVTFR